MLMSNNTSSVVNHELYKRIHREIQDYWFTRPGKLGLAFLAFSTAVSLVVSVFVVFALFNRVVVYEGEIVSGFISLLDYEIYLNGQRVMYPHLESIASISRFFLLFTLIVFSTSLLALRGLFVKWRSWIALVPLSTGACALVVALFYSLLRVLVFDVEPSLWYTVRAATGGLYLYPPRPYYTWIVQQLAWRPLILFLVYTILLALSAGTLFYVLILPKPPVAKTRKRGKPRAEVNKASKGEPL
ncbi:MAG: hypothetical protein QW081_06160 [Desulfurococcaceae archaeon]